MKKLLVANRGEIAIRIMKSAQSKGIRTVAIYSESDVEAPHRFFADESYLVGEGPSSQSYLKSGKIIEIAKGMRCDAIHPGYGFLSENADFAEAVVNAGLIFVGPGPASMRMMGDKLSAKQLAQSLKIPLVPGSDQPITDLESAKEIASTIQYPILLKAAGGGGGKGMRIVRSPEDLDASFQTAASEAFQSFGDARIFIERYLESPRHIEVQIMADHHGNVLHIFERDCSIQRRHQKVIEESPAPHLSEMLRDQMTSAAIRMAKGCKYTGAGTLEFLVDGNDQFYFLEMNTRLQVEHPVSEMISGLDLVAWQLDIANNQPLPLVQDEVIQRGHSIELRIYAEDPLENFSPSLGHLEKYQEPNGEQIRIDSGVRQGYEIPIYYDPLLAKLIVWAENRNEAIGLMKQAIREYQIEGIKTTLPFGNFVLDHKSFREGNYNTRFIEKYFSPENYHTWSDKKAQVAAIAAGAMMAFKKGNKQIDSGNTAWWSARKWNEKGLQ
ncbi:MAG: acetyl-CoA carboxylase biotin carboxylase subunit [Saprospiraceae bacterium]|nr:acetyl-CoA carboxylase biotin carboxylase subunit [Saprospiraceae bacterium]